MKQSGVSSNHDHPEITKHNRIRLTQQNKRLLGEIQKLDAIISGVIERGASNEFESMEEGQQLKKKYSSEQKHQLREINRLKQEIKMIKATIAEHKYDEIKNEENQIVYLRREHDKMATQKHTLLQKKSEKESALAYHQPINNQTAETLEKYKKIKAQNGQLKAKIHQIQREVNKYHKIKQLSKTALPRKNQNADLELLAMNNEMKEMRKKMRRIEDKWKAKIESLDQEYFGFKSILTDKESMIEQLEKEVRTLQNKRYSFRDESMVASDRRRIGSLTISPKKRKEMEDLLLGLSSRSKKLQQQQINPKNKKEKEKKQKVQSQAVSTQNVSAIPQKVEQKQAESDAGEAPVDAQLQVEPEKAKETLPRPRKIVESVGVGTSFYYQN